MFIKFIKYIYDRYPQLGQDSLRKILEIKKTWYERHKAGDFSHTLLCKNCSFMREQAVAWWKDGYF